MLYPYIDRHPRSWTISRDDPGSDLKVTHNHSLWDALAAALGVDSVTVLTTDEDVRPAEREQRDQHRIRRVVPSPEPVVADASGALGGVDAVIDGFGTPDAHPIRHAARGELRARAFPVGSRPHGGTIVSP